MNFGNALEQIKAGHRIARSGWNGKGMFVYLVPAASYPVQTGAAKAHFGEGSLIPYNPYMAIKNVDETVSTWVPSVKDCLAEDWHVVGADQSLPPHYQNSTDNDIFDLLTRLFPWNDRPDLIPKAAAAMAFAWDAITSGVPPGEEQLESAIKASGADKAPRITPEHVEAQIVSEHYFTAAHGVAGAMASLELHQQHFQGTPIPGSVLGTLTFCVLVLKNGFTVTGESACVSPENFDAEIGRDIARRNAFDKIWQLEGYRLKTDLHRAAQAGESHGVAQSSSQSTENQQKSFEQAARPLIKWLAENVHPHHSVYVTSTHAELSEGSRSTGQITEYLRD